MVNVGKRNKRVNLQQKNDEAKKVRQLHREVKDGLKSQLKKAGPRERPLEARGCASQQTEAMRTQTREQEEALRRRRAAAVSALCRKAPTAEREDSKQSLLKDSSRAFVGDVRKLMDEANVIIQVLDARDPNGTRSLEVEKEIKMKNKKLIFVLNKIDLVPADNMKAWLRHLSKENRIFPFKASCQEQAKNIGGGARHAPTLGKIGPAAAFGVDELVNYLKSLTKGANAVTKTLDKLVVGVVGVPNTGKSSVINSLKRKRICEAGNTPGLTRNLQHIALDNHMTLIDSPGIILAQSDDPAEYALRNCIRVEKIEDTVSVAAVIYKRCGRDQLQGIYKLKDFETYEQFIVCMAQRCCPLKKGGIANIRLASVRLINDWNCGKISFCTEPPLPTADDDTLTAEQEEAIRVLTSKAVFPVDESTEIKNSDNLKSVMDVDGFNTDEVKEESNNVEMVE